MQFNIFTLHNSKLNLISLVVAVEKKILSNELRHFII